MRKLAIPFCAVLLLGGLSHPFSASAVVLNDTHVPARSLDLKVSESISEDGVVTDEFDFYMPEFETGTDLRLSKRFFFSERSYFTLTSHEVSGDSFARLYLGSSKEKNPYPEGFMHIRAMAFNGKPLEHRSLHDRGWVRIEHADGSENLLIYVQENDLVKGGRNVLVVEFIPDHRLAAGEAHHENLALSAGYFFPVVDVSATVGPVHHNSFNVTFTLTNTGKPKRLPAGSFHVFFDKDEVGPWEAYEEAVDAPYIANSSVKIRTIANGSKKSYSWLEVSGLDFSQEDVRNVTITVTIDEELESRAINITPAYLLDGDMVFLDQAKIPLEGFCETDMQCQGSEVCLANRCTDSKLHLIYVPVNWKTGLEGFLREAEIQHDYFLDSANLTTCSGVVKRTILEETLHIDNVTSMDGYKVLKTILKGTGKRINESYDFIVAIGAKEAFEGNTAGYTVPGFPVVFVMGGYPIVTAHELGHQFGLKDEYCSCPGLGICDEAPNALQAGLGCDASGDCCWEDVRVFGITLVDSCPLGYEEYGCFKCCHGNKNALGGRSIMSWADAEGPRAHDSTSLRHLASKLRCD